MARNGQSPSVAGSKAAGRLFFWHLLQPPLYLFVLWESAALIDPLQLKLGIAVAVREAGYFVTTLMCCWANPSFLLVDVAASVREIRKLTEDDGETEVLAFAALLQTA